jgi:O-antigen biosynthesis protein WbqV
MIDLGKWLQVPFLRLGSIALDLCVALVAFVGAYAVVLGLAQVKWVPGIELKTGAFLLICVFFFHFFSVTRGSWRYVSIPDLIALVKASLFSVTAYTVGAFLVSRGENVPRSVPVLTLLFLVAGLAATRIAYRLAVEGGWFREIFLGRQESDLRRVLILGVTPEAESFMRLARSSERKRFLIVGMLDDDPSNRGRRVQGVKVLGRLGDLTAATRRMAARGHPVSELIVAEQTRDKRRLSEIVEAATAAGLKVTRVPKLSDTASILTNGLPEPNPIELGDLLGRPEVVSDFAEVARLIEGRTVLATGAGGSIGSELCRQIAALRPARLIMTDASEYHAFLLDKEIRDTHPDLEVSTLLMDVRDGPRVAQVLAAHRPELVFHAAALKHVPLMEYNPLEAIKTNVLGTANVADAAIASGALTFVMVSTDKAVNPTNVMGATKRAAEAYCQALDVVSSSTHFKTVRFGNVLGSNGSVVPRFREQIAAGGPVTVTHPDIVRYFMTIPEAVRLVLNASAHALAHDDERGKIMVLDMGKPIRIVDLAERMIQLAGFRPRTDIDIVFTGLRPGEKLYEELFDPSEVQDSRTEEGYVVASPRVIDKALLHRSLEGLRAAALREDTGRALALLAHIVPEYRHPSPAPSAAPPAEPPSTVPSLVPRSQDGPA